LAHDEGKIVSAQLTFSFKPHLAMEDNMDKEERKTYLVSAKSERIHQLSLWCL